jgi:hypothetical protein
MTAKIIIFLPNGDQYRTIVNPVLWKVENGILLVSQGVPGPNNTTRTTLPYFIESPS